MGRQKPATVSLLLVQKAGDLLQALSHTHNNLWQGLKYNVRAAVHIVSTIVQRAVDNPWGILFIFD